MVTTSQWSVDAKSPGIERVKLSPLLCPYFEMVKDLYVPTDPKSYAYGSIITGRVSHVGQT